MAKKQIHTPRTGASVFVLRVSTAAIGFRAPAGVQVKAGKPDSLGLSVCGFLFGFGGSLLIKAGLFRCELAIDDEIRWQGWSP